MGLCDNADIVVTPSDVSCGTCTGVVFMSKDLLRNPLCVKFLVGLYLREIPVVTVISHEEFPKLDDVLVLELSNSLEIDPDAEPSQIADALESSYKILAWPFHPQESMSVLTVGFKRIEDR